MARRRRKSYTSPLMIARRNRGSRYYHRPGALIHWLKSPTMSPEQARAAMSYVTTTVDNAVQALALVIDEVAPIIGARLDQLNQTLRDLNTPPEQP